MSNLTYNHYWIDANEQLKSRLVYESSTDPAVVPKERTSAYQHLAVLYVKYIQIFKKLEASYDQMVHPQKRRLLKEVVINVLGRLLELRHKLVELEHLDFHNFTDILFDLKLAPDDLKIPVPRFYLEERIDELQVREQLFESLNAKQFSLEKPPLFSEIKLFDAIRLIQINERGRQGQLRAKYMKDIRNQAQREDDIDEGDDEKEINRAALVIQCSYRRFVARKQFKKMLFDELVFLGMEPPPNDTKTNLIAKAELNKERRKLLRKQHEEEYTQALVNTKEKILKVEGPDMREGIQDSFRQWYIEYKRVNGKLPEFPPDEVWQKCDFQFSVQPKDAGSGNADSSAAQGNGGDDKKATAGTGEKGGSSGEKAAGGADEKPNSAGTPKKNSTTPKKGKKQEEEVEEESFKFDNSEFLTNIKENLTTFENEWQSKEESDNFAQKHDQEIIKVEKRKEVEAEIKATVMEVLKEELKNLKSAVERESGRGKKKGGKGGKGGKKSGSGSGKKKGGKKEGKKKGGSAKKGGKKEKDMTANRTMESLIEELIQTGILQSVPKTAISEFKGEHNLFGTTPGVKSAVQLVEPNIAELQRVITEYFILPLGFTPPQEVEETEDEPAKKIEIPSIPTVMLFGPKGSGKSMLVNAIASETGAHIFNLTPRNTIGQFMGKPNVTKMMHMAFKVAKANAPSIIYIDNIEMIFAKKVPKDDQTDPKRIKKDFLKQLKSLSSTDRVLVIGCSSKPWEGETKVLLPLFQKFILCPKPDYPSRFTIWSEFISKRVPSVLKDINISLISRLSAGMTTGQIIVCCERAMSSRRLKLLKGRSLNTNEFVDQIVNLMPINVEEERLFQDWYEKTPLLRKRVAMLTTPVGEEADKNKKKAPAGKPAKK